MCLTDTTSGSLRIVQLAADYAFTFRLDAGEASSVEWIASHVAELPDHGIGRIRHLAEWDAHTHPDDRAALAGARLGASDIALEYRLLAEDGNVRWFRESIATEADADGSVRVWVAGHDITARRLAEGS